jgi:hypothetical protein
MIIAVKSIGERGDSAPPGLPAPIGVLTAEIIKDSGIN